MRLPVTFAKTPKVHAYLEMTLLAHLNLKTTDSLTVLAVP